MLLREHVILDWKRMDEHTLSYTHNLPGRCTISAQISSVDKALDLALWCQEQRPGGLARREPGHLSATGVGTGYRRLRSGKDFLSLGK